MITDEFDRRRERQSKESLIICPFKRNFVDRTSMEINGKYVQFQLLINCLLQMKSSEADREEFFSFYRRKYANDFIWNTFLFICSTTSAKCSIDKVFFSKRFIRFIAHFNWSNKCLRSILNFSPGRTITLEWSISNGTKPIMPFSTSRKR